MNTLTIIWESADLEGLLKRIRVSLSLQKQPPYFNPGGPRREGNKADVLEGGTCRFVFPLLNFYEAIQLFHTNGFFFAPDCQDRN